VKDAFFIYDDHRSRGILYQDSVIIEDNCIIEPGSELESGASVVSIISICDSFKNTIHLIPSLVPRFANQIFCFFNAVNSCRSFIGRLMSLTCNFVSQD
jgi:hypothetical protein